MNGRLIGLTFGLAAMSAACQTWNEAPESVSDPYASLTESDIYVQLGVQYMEQGVYDVALEDLNRALEADGGSSEAHNALGVLNERLKRLPDAEHHFQRALSLQPDNFSARNNYGRFLCGRGRSAEAMQQFQRVIDEPLYRQPWIPLTNAGLCARASGQAGVASDYFRRALERNPQFAPALLESAKLSMAMHQYPNAQVLLQRYRSVVRPTPEALWLSAQTESALGERGNAAEFVERLRREYPDSREAQQAGAFQLGH
jgi:type IV pilus assembly protein PilF